METSRILLNKSLHAPAHTTTAVASQADNLYREGHVMFSQSQVLYKLALFVGAAMQSPLYQPALCLVFISAYFFVF